MHHHADYRAALTPAPIFNPRRFLSLPPPLPAASGGAIVGNLNAVLLSDMFVKVA
jgi:hypothetical protein